MMELVRLIWRWKWFIILGTLLFAIATAYIVGKTPATYRFETILMPADFDTIFTLREFKNFIESGGMNDSLTNRLKLNNHQLSKEFRFRVDILKQPSRFRVVHYTKNPDQGLRVLAKLNQSIIEQYTERFKNIRDSIQRKIDILQKEKDSSVEIISMIEEYIMKLNQKSEDIVRNKKIVQEYIKSLINEDKKFKSYKNDNNRLVNLMHLQTILHQNNQIYNSYELVYDDILLKIESARMEILKSVRKIIEIDGKLFDLENELKQLGNIKVVRAPFRSEKPLHPDLIANIIFSSVVGLIVLICLVFFIENIFRKVKK